MQISTPRLFLLLAAPFVFVGIASRVVEGEIDHASATPGGFGLLVIVYNLLVAPLLNRVEAMVFGTAQRPWLGGRLRWWQRLILPYSTTRVLTLGLGAAFGGGAYLLGAPPGGGAVNLLAVLLCAFGGALLGFGMARLAVGIFIIRCSGLWAASRKVWLAGGIVVAIGSLAFAAHSLLMTMRLSPVI